MEQLIEGLTPLGHQLPPGTVEAIARGVHGDARARDQALSLIQRYLATRPKVVSGLVPYALTRLGHPGEGLEILGRGPTGNDSLPLAMLWGPYGRESRKLPQFSDLLRRARLVELWDKEGPPDLCRRVESGKYVCD